MLIDAVCVCDGYADFLRETLPENLPHLNRMVVVTGRDDWETREVCSLFSVECRSTSLMQSASATFAKARGIDYGLAYLASTNWVLHLDADIALPPDMRRRLMRRPMDTAGLYGADRVYCDSYEQWRTYLGGHKQQHKFNYRLDSPGFWQGSRLIIDAYDGYLPPGYFQLWHGTKGYRYPTTQQDGAEHTDVLHAIQWDAIDRHLLPDFYVIHLDSGRAIQGANWRGRRTPRFCSPQGPNPLPGAKVEPGEGATEGHGYHR